MSNPPGRKYQLRLQMPSDDEILEAFLAAQGPRGAGPAILQLIHMWTREFGATDVIDTCLGTLTMGTLGAQPLTTIAESSGVAPTPRSAVAGPTPADDQAQSGISAAQLALARLDGDGPADAADANPTELEQAEVEPAPSKDVTPAAANSSNSDMESLFTGK